MIDAPREQALRWCAAAQRAVVVEVSAHQGSVPRETGTRMLVSAHEVVGTIGGGQLELKAINDARSLLASGSQQRIEQRIALGPALGQCCGGVVHLRFTLLAQQDPDAWAAPAARFHLQIYGAGHVGRAIVSLLEAIPCQVQWMDERESEFPQQAPPPHIVRVCVEPVPAEVATAPGGAFYLVMTHQHDLDLAITRAILARGDFGFLGLIGSQSKRARFEHRLRERGADEALLARIVCPIGIAGIAGKEPEVIAVAVVAQLLQTAASRDAAEVAAAAPQPGAGT